MSHNDESETPKSTGVNRRQFITRTAAGAAGAVALTSVLDACGGSSSNPVVATDEQQLTTQAWKFGVISDTQWIAQDDGYNPNTSAVGIAAQIQQQLIAQGVVFAVHVGDLCDMDVLSTTSGAANDSNTNPASNANAGEYTRALYSQALYNAGIGFFPLRGNHDEDQAGAQAFLQCYPQTLNGQHANPSAVLSKFNESVSTDYYLNADAGNNPVPANSGSNFTIGTNFSSPSPSYAVVGGVNGLAGLTYSFDYNGARFILLDQFAPSNGAYPYSQMDASIGGDSSASYASFFGSAQQPWISQQLSGRSGSHTFVFAHKGLVTGNHADNLFSTSGGSCNNNPTAQNAFMSSLYNNGVRMYMNGHDHMHDRSIVNSPDGKSTVMQLTCVSDSSKFYGPQGSGTNNNTVFPYGSNTAVSTLAPSTPSAQMSNDIYWNVQQTPGGSQRRQVLSQELYTIGYYIFTVNGSLVNVDYYSADVPAYPSSSKPSEFVVNTAQGLNFVKRESWGYGLNGKQFIVAKGGAYTGVSDSSSGGTTVNILNGTNNCATTDACYLPYVKVVTTGWMSQSYGSLSDIVMLRGINPFEGASNPDTYVLAMKTGGALRGVVICALNSNGNWNNAVNQNSGGTKKYVYGPWSASYGLGTYGIDPTTNSAWAVLNYDGIFAIAPGS